MCAAGATGRHSGAGGVICCSHLLICCSYLLLGQASCAQVEAQPMVNFGVTQPALRVGLEALAKPGTSLGLRFRLFEWT